LPGGSSLQFLLRAERGANAIERAGNSSRSKLKLRKSRFTIPNILAWADAFHDRTGAWPVKSSGPVAESPGDNWDKVHSALRLGNRGLPGGSSLCRLLEQERGVRNLANLPRLTITEILRWADAHHDRHGSWPGRGSGPIPLAPGETWHSVCRALDAGARGLPRPYPFAQLLSDKGRVSIRRNSVPFTIEGILSWADAHRARTGDWPKVATGAIPESPGDTWEKVHSSLRKGDRGLPGGSTLAKLLAGMRGRRHPHYRPDLTVLQILEWADAFHARTGGRPIRSSGPILESPGETWWSVDAALRHGTRGLSGSSCLSALLGEERGRRNPSRPPDLTIPQILGWADSYESRNGRWPNGNSGPIPELPGETWWAVRRALKTGSRGLPGGMNLRDLRRQYRSGETTDTTTDQTGERGARAPARKRPRPPRYDLYRGIQPPAQPTPP
jgi:hypothetical protein